MPDNRFIVITGASRGLSRAMTDGFISAGQTVAGCARSNEAIADLRNQFGPPHRFEAVDVSNHQKVEKWASSILEGVGTPDILINSAAVINQNAPLWDALHSRWLCSAFGLSCKRV